MAAFICSYKYLLSVITICGLLWSTYAEFTSVAGKHIVLVCLHYINVSNNDDHFLPWAANQEEHRRYFKPSLQPFNNVLACVHM